MRRPLVAAASLAGAVAIAMACGKPFAIGPAEAADGDVAESGPGPGDAAGCAPGFCAGRDAALCDDFDRTNIDDTKAWGVRFHEDAGPELVADNGECPAASLHAVLPESPGAIQRGMFRAVYAPYHDLTVEADITFTFEPETYSVLLYGNTVAIGISPTEADVASGKGIALVADHDGAALVVATPPTPSTRIKLPLPSGRPSKVRYRVALDSENGKIEVSIDGRMIVNETAQALVPKDFAFPTSFVVGVGLRTTRGGPTEVNIDNLVVTAN